MKVIVKQNINS